MKRFILAVLLVGMANTNVANSGTFSSSEYRTPIPVTPQERNQVLYEMRAFLHGMHNIHHALGRNDIKAVAVEVKPMNNLLDRFPPSLRERLPESFLMLANGLRESLDQLTKISENNGPMNAVHEQLAEAVTYCSGCHDTFHFEVVRKLPKPVAKP